MQRTLTSSFNMKSQFLHSVNYSAYCKTNQWKQKNYLCTPMWSKLLNVFSQISPKLKKKHNKKDLTPFTAINAIWHSAFGQQFSVF